MKSPSIMGIINVTPDSFSGDGLLSHQDYIAQAVAQAEQMVKDGADILDIGGESSRPGAAPVAAEEEIRRTVPVIAAIKQKLDIPIAIDTAKAVVAEAALQAGATIINDIWALTRDDRMPATAKRYNATIVLMHNRSAANHVAHDARIGGYYEAADYGDVVEEVRRDLEGRADAAVRQGIAREKIILDPGIGFGKSVPQNLTLIAHLDCLKSLGFPVLAGVSRKSFIGHVLDTPVDERLEGTAASVAAAVLRGADIVRVHDVRFMARVARMAMAIKNA